MVAGFAYAAVTPGGRDVAIMSTLLSAAFTLWSLALALWKHWRPLELPQWTLFLTISIAGAIGLRQN